MKGWSKFHELKDDAELPMRGFMAMKYKDKAIDLVFNTCFTRAAERAGFTLLRTDEEPRAGLIDDQIRVDIRRSRFVIADLTRVSDEDYTEGAYWEAGYAEALGKPVIYTCRTGYQGKVHFDANHHLTIEWHPDLLKITEDKLTATLRASLLEANQEDKR
jgi:hypothetical protein